MPSAQATETPFELESSLAEAREFLDEARETLVDTGRSDPDEDADHPDSYFNENYSGWDLHEEDKTWRQMQEPLIFDPRLNRHVNCMDNAYLYDMDNVVFPQPARHLPDRVHGFHDNPTDAKSSLSDLVAELEKKSTSASQASCSTKRQYTCRRVLTALASQAIRLRQSWKRSRVHVM